MGQNVIFLALAIAVGMIVACISDLVTGYPFAGQTTTDIIFILCACIVGWMGISSLKGLRRR